MTRATERAYNELQQAFDFYNQRLFNGELPDCLITFQRGKNTMGYFSFRRLSAIFQLKGRTEPLVITYVLLAVHRKAQAAIICLQISLYPLPDPVFCIA